MNKEYEVSSKKRIASINTINKVNLKKKNEIKETIKQLENKVTPNFAFIYGSILGDGSIVIRKRDNKMMAQIILVTKDNDYAENFKNAFEEWSSMRCKLTFYKRVWLVSCYSLAVAMVLKEFDKNRLLDYPDVILGNFLKGIFDAEGSVDIGSKRVSMANTNTELIELTRKILYKLNIESNIQKQKMKVRFLENRMLPESVIYSVRISGRVNIKKFHEKVSFSIFRKQRNLEKILTSYKHENPIRKWTVYELEFLKNNMCMKPSEISKKLNRGVKTVWQKRYELRRLSKI